MKKNLKLKIESLLLVTTKPLKINKLKDLIKGAKLEEVRWAVGELKEKFNREDSGLRIIENNGVIQFTTAPESAELVKKFIKDETTGELTRPSLETLTIIAYRQPITKAELEQIRGVNCSMILRNLMIRGLVMKKDVKKMLTSYYFVTVDFLKFLGITDISELPDFDKLNDNKNLKRLLNPDEIDEDEDAHDNANGASLHPNDTDITNNTDNTKKDEDKEGGSFDDPVRLTVNVYS